MQRGASRSPHRRARVDYGPVSVWVGGDEGTRTPDPCDANAVLSQLSYIPTESAKYTDEVSGLPPSASTGEAKFRPTALAALGGALIEGCGSPKRSNSAPWMLRPSSSQTDSGWYRLARRAPDRGRGRLPHQLSRGAFCSSCPQNQPGVRGSDRSAAPRTWPAGRRRRSARWRSSGC